MQTARPRHPRVRALEYALLAVATVATLTACGSDDPATTTPSSSTSAPQDTGAEGPADVLVDVTVAGDQITTASDRVDVEVGQTVQMTVTSDTAQEVHVHGFDLMLDLEAGEPGTLEFEVTDDPGPGLYEVELEGPGLLLFQLEVR
jgi:predicted small lipoprotein YifL